MSVTSARGIAKMQRIRRYPNTFCPCKTNAKRKVIPVKASNASPPITISMIEYILMRVTVAPNGIGSFERHFA
jgi:hypothetical protein